MGRAFVLLLLTTSFALAQERTLGADAPPLAEQRYQIGIEHYRNGEFPQAAAEFRKALALYDRSPRLAYNLARTLERTGEVADSVRFYGRYLELAPDAEDADSVRQLIVELEKKVEADRATLILISDPPGARVYVDGADEPLAGATPTRARIDPGGHLLVLRLPGHQDRARSVEVEARQTLTIEETLEPGVSGETPGAADFAPRGPTNWAAWGVVIGGAAVLAGGAAFHVASLGTADDADALTPALTDDHERDTLRDDYDSQLLIARVGYGVGGAAVVGGVLWLLLDDGDEVAVAPTPGGVLAAWRF